MHINLPCNYSWLMIKFSLQIECPLGPSSKKPIHFLNPLFTIEIIYAEEKVQLRK